MAKSKNPPITDHSSRRDAPAYRGEGTPRYRRPGRAIVAASRLPVARVPPAAAKSVDVRVELACLAARAQDRCDTVEEATELRRLGGLGPGLESRSHCSCCHEWWCYGLWVFCYGEEVTVADARDCRQRKRVCQNIVIAGGAAEFMRRGLPQCPRLVGLPTWN